MSPSGVVGILIICEMSASESWWVRKVSPSGVGHSYDMCRHLVVLAYLVRVRGETSGGLDR